MKLLSKGTEHLLQVPYVTVAGRIDCMTLLLRQLHEVSAMLEFARKTALCVYTRTCCKPMSYIHAEIWHRQRATLLSAAIHL